MSTSSRSGRSISAIGPAPAWIVAGGPVGLAFARRLDPAFVVDARDVTGFDGAVFDRSGQLKVASDQVAAEAFSPDPTSDPAARPMSLRAGLVGGSMALPGLDGRPAGWFVATMPTGGVQTIGSRLLPLLGVGLMLAVAASVVLAILLGRRLRRRIDAIEGGLSAMAAGDLDVRLPADSRDEIGRLATALDRTAETLARRDRILRQAIVAIGELTPGLGVERVETDGLAAAATIFDLDDCRLEDLDLAAGPPPEADPRLSASEPIGRLVFADLGPVAADGSVEARQARLTGRLPAGRDWSEAEQSLLDVYARLLRAAIDDAAIHARALDRADRLGRLARLQGDFLRGVSHNLQAPLTNIVVVSDELATADNTDAHAREGVAVIRSEADRLARLVGQLLTLSRLESGTLRVEAEPVAPAPIIERVWRSLRSRPAVPRRRPIGRDVGGRRPGGARAGRLDAPRQRPEVRPERPDQREPRAVRPGRADCDHGLGHRAGDRARGAGAGVPPVRARVDQRGSRGNRARSRRRARPRPGDGRIDPLRAQSGRRRGLPIHRPGRAFRAAGLTIVRGSTGTMGLCGCALS